VATEQERPPFAYGGKLLAPLAGLSDLAPCRIYTGSAVVAAGASSVFCKTALGNGVGGAIVGIYFYLDSEDYQTSPVSLVQFGAQGTGQQTSASSLGGSPWNVQLGRDRQPFLVPTPFSIPFGNSMGAGLQVTNNEAVPVYVEGILVVTAWPVDARREAQDEIDRSSGGPFGGGRLFS
jgi:hypothetical protein